jgi:hypothetical protein
MVRLLGESIQPRLVQRDQDNRVFLDGYVFTWSKGTLCIVLGTQGDFRDEEIPTLAALGRVLGRALRFTNVTPEDPDGTAGRR